MTSGPFPHRVAVVTGSRSEFGLLEPVITRLERSPRLALELYAAGMHLVPELGLSVREVEARFRLAGAVPMAPPTDTPTGMAQAVARGLEGFVDLFASRPPALLCLLGDRTEVFAAALAAAYLGIPIAHIHGGDVSGHRIDDFQRDAISRLSALHFAATPTSAHRLEALGVTGPIEIVGAPGLDAILSEPASSAEAVASRLDLPTRRWLVVLHHPTPATHTESRAEIAEVLAAAAEVAAENEAAVVLIYPNNDAGHRDIVQAIRRAEEESRLSSFENLPREDYLNLLRHALLLIGNSSSGIIESASLGLRVVNVGERQRGRERNSNVVDAPPCREAIARAARHALTDPGIRDAVERQENLYGDGTAGERIVGAIEGFLEARPGG